MLIFAEANSKTKKLYKVEGLDRWLKQTFGKRKAKVYSFSILSGVDCPFAKECKSRAVETGKGNRTIQDGPHTKFRCFSATQEMQYDAVYFNRLHNHNLIHSCKDEWEMADAIGDAIPDDAGVVRIHIAGDFFNHTYFRAWMIVASRFPQVLFYAYTKSLQYWVRNRDYLSDNFVLTASRGGRSDKLIKKYNLRSARVVFSEAEAVKLGLDIDDDDSTASDPTKRDQDFALLIHGTQPAGSKASKALMKILKANKIVKQLTTAEAMV